MGGTQSLNETSQTFLLWLSFLELVWPTMESLNCQRIKHGFSAPSLSSMAMSRLFKSRTFFVTTMTGGFSCSPWSQEDLCDQRLHKGQWHLQLSIVLGCLGHALEGKCAEDLCQQNGQMQMADLTVWMKRHLAWVVFAVSPLSFGVLLKAVMFASALQPRSLLSSSCLQQASTTLPFICFLMSLLVVSYVSLLDSCLNACRWFVDARRNQHALFLKDYIAFCWNATALCCTGANANLFCGCAWDMGSLRVVVATAAKKEQAAFHQWQWSCLHQCSFILNSKEWLIYSKLLELFLRLVLWK